MIKGIEELQKEEHQIWISHKHPERSSWEKTFPYKIVFSTLLLFGLFLHFFLLGQRLAKKM